MDINNLLTKEQISTVCRIINEQCRLFAAMEDNYDELFYEPYTTYRRSHSLTSAVLSGFAPKRLDDEGLTAVDIYYGLNNRLSQPEIYTDSSVFHIYSSGSDLKGKRILELAEMMNADLNMPPVFFLVIFTLISSLI